MPSRTTTRTIRIEDDLDRKIGQLARTEGTSVNFIINSALREYTEWSIIIRKFGLASYHASLVNRLIQKFGETEIEELGKWSAHEGFVPFADYQFGELTFQTFLETSKRFAKYAGRFKFDASENENGYLIFLKHGSGRKWSVYWASVIRTVCEDFLNVEIKLELTDDLVVAKINFAHEY